MDQRVPTNFSLPKKIIVKPISGLELRYRDSLNTILIVFSVQVFPPSQKITIPKYEIVSLSLAETQNFFLILPIKKISICTDMFSERIFVVFLLLLLAHINCLMTRFFSLVKIEVSSFQQYIVFLSVRLYTKSCFILCLQKQLSEVFYKKGVLRNFAKLIGKHLCQSIFFNNIAGLVSIW